MQGTKVNDTKPCECDSNEIDNKEEQDDKDPVLCFCSLSFRPLAAAPRPPFRLSASFACIIPRFQSCSLKEGMEEKLRFLLKRNKRGCLQGRVGGGWGHVVHGVG